MLPVDLALKDAKPEGFDALVLPGGVANPDKLRILPEAVLFVQSFVAANKPIAAICHGPWTLIEAGAVKGKRMTSWPSLKLTFRMPELPGLTNPSSRIAALSPRASPTISLNSMRQCSSCLLLEACAKSDRNPYPAATLDGSAPVPSWQVPVSVARRPARQAPQPRAVCHR